MCRASSTLSCEDMGERLPAAVPRLSGGRPAENTDDGIPLLDGGDKEAGIGATRGNGRGAAEEVAGDDGILL